jgi:hypothetical protein
MRRCLHLGFAGLLGKQILLEAVRDIKRLALSIWTPTESASSQKRTLFEDQMPLPRGTLAGH